MNRQVNQQFRITFIFIFFALLPAGSNILHVPPKFWHVSKHLYNIQLIDYVPQDKHEDGADASSLAVIEAFCATLQSTDSDKKDDSREIFGLFALIPDETILRILSHLPLSSLCGALPLVCADFHRITADEFFWRDLFARDFAPLTLSPEMLTHYGKTWRWVYRARSVTLTAQNLADLKLPSPSSTPLSSPPLSPRLSSRTPMVIEDEDDEFAKAKKELELAMQTGSWLDLLRNVEERKKKEREDKARVEAEREKSRKRSVIGCVFDVDQNLYQFGEWTDAGLTGYAVNAWLTSSSTSTSTSSTSSSTSTSTSTSTPSIYEGEFVAGRLNGYARIATSTMTYIGNCSLPIGGRLFG